MALQTVNRRSIKKVIKPTLEAAVYISRYHDDGQDATSRNVTAEDVLKLAERFQSVTLDTDSGVMSVVLNSCHFYTVYPSREVMKSRMTDIAFTRAIATLDGAQ